MTLVDISIILVKTIGITTIWLEKEIFYLLFSTNASMADFSPVPIIFTNFFLEFTFFKFNFYQSSGFNFKFYQLFINLTFNFN